MACEVTKDDLTKDIKQSLLNIKRARPIDGSSIFVPITQGAEQSFKADLRDSILANTQQYLPKVYGEQVSVEYNEFGAILRINASEQLAEDMTAQNIRDEIDENPRLYQLSQNKEIEKFVASEKTIRDLAARMSDRIGIPVRFEADKTKEYKGKLENGTAVVNLANATLDTPIHEILGHPIIRTIKNNTSKTFEVGNYEGGESLGTFNTREEAQEFIKNHPNGDMLGISSPTIHDNKLYQNLLKELEYGKGKEVLDRVKRDYTVKDTNKKYSIEPLSTVDGIKYELTLSTGDKYNIPKALSLTREFELSKSKIKTIHDTKEKAQKALDEYLKENPQNYSLEEQQEEAIVELLGLYTAGKLDKVKDGKLISLLKRLLKEMKAFMRSLINQKEIEIDKLSDNMTLGDIADLLAYSNSKLILPGNEVVYTTPDNQQFKTYAEASKHISDLTKSVEDVDLSSVKIEKKSVIGQIDPITNKRIKNAIFIKGAEPEWSPDDNVYFPGEPDSFELQFDDGSNNTVYDEDLFRNYDEEVNQFYRQIKFPKNTIENFIEKNKQYEQSKEIVEEWKKVNNIQYNPEEVYSRGQEFVSVVGAYSDFDVNLMMQNLLQHIEDNQKAGGEFTISAFTKPVDRKIGHLEGGGGKIKFKIYPQSQDIKWAANTDVYSGSVWDASKKVSKDKKSELLGVSYSKYPSLRNVNEIQPNLANIIDNLAHHHNELGISLTGSNFRLEYDENIPYSTKKIIDNINSILDQKYGELVKPEIKKQGEKVVQYGLFSKGANDILDWFDTKEEAQAKVDESNKQLKDLGEPADYSVKPIIKSIGIQPTQTKESLKKDIKEVEKEILYVTEEYNEEIRSLAIEIDKLIEEYIETEEPNLDKKIKDLKNKRDELIKKRENSLPKKEYTKQALINTKIAKLKEVAKKYPRSLIRSEVRPISQFEDTQQHEMFDIDELPFQKISKSSREFQNKGSNEAFTKHEFKNEKRPVTDNYAEYLNYKRTQLEKAKATLSQLHKDRRNPKKNSSDILNKINTVNNIRAKIQNDIEHLEKNEVDLMFTALIEEIEDINNNLDNITTINREDIKNRLDFLFKFVKGSSIDSREKSDIESLKNFKHPDFSKISLAVDDLKDKYEEKLEEIRNQILESDISFRNNVLENPNITEEEIKEMFENQDDITWLERTFLGINTSSRADSVLPQVLKSYLETKMALREAEVKRYQDRLHTAINKLKGENFDFIFETSRAGVRTGNIINLFSPLFQEKLRDYFNISNDEETSEKEKYRDKVKWLKQNAEVIDFRKLKVVQELYGDLYSEHFTFNDAQMDAYEEKLKRELGPLYDEEIEKVLNNLEIFQEEKINFLDDTSNQYRYRNIARIDPWAFIKNYNSPHSTEPIPYTSGGTNVSQVYSNIDNIRFIPKKDIYVTFDSSSGEEIYQDSGYFNKDFNEVLQDPNKLEYWKLIKEIYSDYINPTYSEDKLNEMSYAKFETTWLETFEDGKGLLNKKSKLYKQSKAAFKSLFYETGRDQNDSGVINNYGDSTKNQIRQFSKILQQKSMSELKDIAEKEDINTEKLTKEKLVKEIATKKVISQYSFDINKVTGALLDKAAEQKAKEDTLPIADIILESHKMIKSLKIKDGKHLDRKRSIERLENWIDRVIKNQNEKYRGSTSFLGKDIANNTKLEWILNKAEKIPFVNKYINKKRAYLLTDNEKEILKHLEDLRVKGHNINETTRFKIEDITYSLQPNSSGSLAYYKVEEEEVFEIDEVEFEEAFQKNVENKIQELGLDLNAAGMIQGILKMIIVKGLGLNPISGIFNRIEGKNSGLIMDRTGKYWTPGNLQKSNNFMAFANFMKFVPERLKPSQLRKVNELKKLQVFINNVNLIQDRKNELERQAQKSDLPKFDYASKLNLFQFAVDNPEFKNQGAILLSILMDTMITNPTTGEQVAIFNGKEFPAHDLVEGKLVLKPEFRSNSNISNWENFEIDENDIANNQFFLTRSKIKTAISRSQGNYDNLDVIDATKNIWGRSLTLFMKWMPEHFMQRFGKGEGIDITTGKSKLKGRYRSLLENSPALATTGALTLFTTFGLSPIAGIAGLGLSGFIAYRYFKKLYSKQQIKSEIDTAKEFTAFTKSIVIETLNYPLELVNVSKTIPNNTYGKTNLSQEEIGNLTAVAKELGVKLTMISFMLLAKSLTWDEDDDKDSERRQFHNFVDNQFNRIINALDVWMKPDAFITDLQRFAFLRYLSDVSKFLISAATLNEDKKLEDKFIKITPIPRILHKGTMPYLDEKEYEASQWQDKMIRDNASDGEYSGKKKYEKLREQILEDIVKDIRKSGLKGKRADMRLKALKRKRLPSRKSGQTYKSAIKNLKRINRIKD